MPPRPRPAPPTHPPHPAHPATPGQCAACPVGGSVRIRGNHFGQILENPAQKDALKNEVQRSLATALAVSDNMITVNDLTVGSLIVNYTVAAAAGVTAATVQAGFCTFWPRIRGSSWECARIDENVARLMFKKTSIYSRQLSETRLSVTDRLPFPLLRV